MPSGVERTAVAVAAVERNSRRFIKVTDCKEFAFASAAPGTVRAGIGTGERSCVG
jgi:hypothetical protein